MKQKEIIFGTVFVLVLGIAGFYIFVKNSSTKPQEQPQAPKEEVIPTLQPEDIGLSFTARDDKKAVKIAIDKLSDIKHFDYEITYDATSDEDGSKVSRGVTGELDVKPGEKTYESEYLDLGTCSSSSGIKKCKYDKGVTTVKLLLKVTKTDGKVYQVEKSLEL